jgi:hypothetical protein
MAVVVAISVLDGGKILRFCFSSRGIRLFPSHGYCPAGHYGADGAQYTAMDCTSAPWLTVVVFVLVALQSPLTRLMEGHGQNGHKP